MGQKVNPNSIRFGLNRNWVSRWNTKDGRLRAKWILDDEKIRKILVTKFRGCGIGHVEIERFLREDRECEIVVYMHVSQIGLFATGDQMVENMYKAIKMELGKKTMITIHPIELANPGVCATLIGQEIVDTIEGRIPHRPVAKRAIKKAMMSGALGIKLRISGRINGVEIAKNETYSDGSVPLSTFRADIDYSFQTAKTSYGIIGVKVWVYRGMYMGKKFMPLPEAPTKTPRSKDDKNSKVFNK